MKILSVLKASGLAIAVGSVLAAASVIKSNDAAVGAGIGHTIEGRSTPVMPRAYYPLIPFEAGVKEYTTEAFVAIILGAVTAKSQLQYLCENSDVLTTRLNAQGYNTTYIYSGICGAAKKPLITDADANTQVITAMSKLFSVQALDSTLGNQNALCNIFSAEGGNNVGLDGTFVHNEICGAGG